MGGWVKGVEGDHYDVIGFFEGLGWVGLENGNGICVRVEKGKVKVLLVEGGGSVGVRSAEACEPPGGVGGGDGRDGFCCVF